MDFLFALGQIVCIIGLAYGAYLALTCIGRNPRRPSSDEVPAAAPNAPSAPRAGYDELTGPSRASVE